MSEGRKDGGDRETKQKHYDDSHDVTATEEEVETGLGILDL